MPYSMERKNERRLDSNRFRPTGVVLMSYDPFAEEPLDDDGKEIFNPYTPPFPKEYATWLCGCQNIYLGSCCREPLTEDNWSIEITNDDGFGEAHIRHFFCPRDKEKDLK